MPLDNISGPGGGGGGGSGTVTSVNGDAGPDIVLDKTDIGLSNVDNTSDASKPVSSDTQTALNLKADDADVSNIDNTSDADKPVSTAQATAIGVAQSAIDDHEADVANPHSVTQAQVGLGNVDNTSDADKVISDATQTALNLKMDAPAFADGSIPFSDSGVLAENNTKLNWDNGSEKLVVYNLEVINSTDLQGDVKVNSLNDSANNWSIRVDDRQLIFPGGTLAAKWSDDIAFELGNLVDFKMTGNFQLPSLAGQKYLKLDGGSIAQAVDIAPDVLATELTGYVATTGIVGSSDTILSAFTKKLDKGYYELINQNGFNGGYSDITRSFDFRPLQSSPDESWILHNYQLNIDPDLSGFEIGTNNGAVTFYEMSMVHQGTSDIGQLKFIRNDLSIGNGTDPIFVKGMSVYETVLQFQPNVTLKNGFNGFGFLVGQNASAINDSSIYVNAFYDSSNWAAPDMGPYCSANFSPTIASMRNNANAAMIQIYPIIPLFNGNSGFQGINISPNLGTFDTGSFTGLNINPSITSVGNANGIYVSMQNVIASGNKCAAFLDGELKVTGRSDVGRFNAGFEDVFEDNLGNGQPKFFHAMSVNMNAHADTANAATGGINFVVNTVIDAGVQVTTDGLLGVTGQLVFGLPAVNTGANLDVYNNYVSAFILISASDGTIDQAKAAMFSGVRVGGAMGVNRYYGVHSNLPTGPVALADWSGYFEHAPFYIEKALILGGDTASNSDIAFEIKIKKAAKFTPMTTVERDALAALEGMHISNSDTNKAQYYTGSSWVNLGSDGALETYKYTLNGTDITNQNITLPSTPSAPLKVRMIIIGGCEQENSVDFDVTGAVLNWAALGYDSLAESGDVIIVSYTV